MVKFLKFIVIGVIGLALVVLGVANVRPVTLSLLPEQVDGGAYSIDGVPLSLVVFLAVVLGVVIGEIFEYFREHKHRRQVRDRGAEIEKLRAENARLKAKLADPKEDLPRIAAQ